MTKIMDTLRAGHPSPPALDVRGQRRASATAIDVRDAVTNFLTRQPDVREVRVTKAVQIDPDEGTWEVEAEVYLPNPTIRRLGLPVQKEVVDCHEFLVRLDAQLNVVAYGPTESVVDRDMEAP